MKRGLFRVSVTMVSLLVLPYIAKANNFVVGSSSNGNVTLNNANNWIVVRSATVNIPGGDGAAHGCVATASADMDNDGAVGVENQYRFVLSRNDTNPTTNGGSERLLELVDNDGADDPDLCRSARRGRLPASRTTMVRVAQVRTRFISSAEKLKAPMPTPTFWTHRSRSFARTRLENSRATLLWPF